ncbi:hypothetical protein BZA05DRAFT_404277 [Tricharina praecox]|uniref:uncharacterized protein n=1 Tax=Tricharina praecox TaxID=43433 RepID=UPI00221EEB8D|nr:uncharacterized protein BZA05DRAFT_404277 [Tricharina praecox]KAI5848054.1 hypothetical protein BZA05DRAFT_404277 [Tricharina praecox]
MPQLRRMRIVRGPRWRRCFTRRLPFHGSFLNCVEGDASRGPGGNRCFQKKIGSRLPLLRLQAAVDEKGWGGDCGIRGVKIVFHVSVFPCFRLSSVFLSVLLSARLRIQAATDILHLHLQLQSQLQFHFFLFPAVSYVLVNLHVIRVTLTSSSPRFT